VGARRHAVTRPLRQRAASMVERVGFETARAIDTAAAAVVTAAVEAALVPRDRKIEDDHDVRALHPARTVLILLADTECRDPVALAAAAFVETLDGELTAPRSSLAMTAGAEAVRLMHQVPVPGHDAEQLLELLVSAEEPAVLIALAERLDHARHLHLRPGLDWEAFHAEIENTYLPVAARIAPQLARRLDRWAESFGRRLLVRKSQQPE
jgi:hypothetical protein